MQTGTGDFRARSLTPATKSGPVYASSSGWISRITGELVSSTRSIIPTNIAQLLMLKAGIANLCSFATARISFIFINIAALPPSYSKATFLFAARSPTKIFHERFYSFLTGKGIGNIHRIFRFSPPFDDLPPKRYDDIIILRYDDIRADTISCLVIPFLSVYMRKSFGS